jgi:hypothetical protein
VVAERYIRTANIRSETNVIIEGKGASGGVFGGQTWAMNSITSNNVGTERSTTTLLAVGIVPDLFDEYKRKRAESEEAQSTRQALLDAIGIPALKPELIKEAIVKKAHKREEILGWVEKANEIGKTLTTCLTELKELSEKMKDGARKAYLDVTNTAHLRTRIRIGSTETVLEEEQKAVRIHMDLTGEQGGGIVCTPLSEAQKAKPAEESKEVAEKTS